MGIAKEVCRIEKIKSVGALGGAYQHNLRIKETKNADEQKMSYNIELTDRPAGKPYVDCFNEKIASSPWYQGGQHKIAKNAIYAVEFMLTFGNEAADLIDIEAWSRDNLNWLKYHFGGEDNLISIILHVDEKTPHIHAIVIPFDEKGKLNYTKYLGGSKYRLSELQDSYHEEVGKQHRLDRGMKGSKARHQDIDNFYSMVNEAVAVHPLPTPEQKEGIFKKGETANQYKERVSPLIQHAQSVATAKEKENNLLKQKIANIEHLQKGVVPLDQHTQILEELQETKADLNSALRDKRFYSNWVVQEQTERKKLENEQPGRIAAAVKKATEALEDMYYTVRESYNSLKKKFDRLTQDYDSLFEDYEDVSRKYQELQQDSSDTQHLKRDSELMYAIMDNHGISHIYDKYKSSQKEGYSMSGSLEIAKYKSRHQKVTPKEKPLHRTQVR